jgi:uncharacterized protein (TIGR00661 family)
MPDKHKKRIIVAPLNWGLGHATRCIPIINALIKQNFEPIIASDGDALGLLKKEYPKLKAFELPSYNITYPKKATRFKLKLLKDSPHLLKTIKKEKKTIDALVEEEHISGIISDNRFGVRHKHIPSVFITHQLRVLSGSTTWLSSKLHQNIISKFDECWVPDHIGTKNLSGDLGHIKGYKHSVKYLGPLTRFKKLDRHTKYDLMVLLSGPEPQRSYLEQKLLGDLKHYKGNVLFIKGKIEAEQKKETRDNMLVYNFMTSTELEIAINESDLILSRSGYTTIMDLAKLDKKAFFIPTPGQFEQEYLAKKFTEEAVAPSAKQNKFNIKMLANVDDYTGFQSQDYLVNYKKLFGLF